MRRIPDVNNRRQFWDDVLDGPAANAMYDGDVALADSLIGRRLRDWGGGPLGFVSLVGAGPGDPGLLTIKALQCFERADVVFYDNLVSPDVVAMARRDARLVYVGKRRAFHAVRQESINEMLVEAARAGDRVVRLKGGDPFVFGRGGEEIETLAEQGIPFEVVPGITAALGCASYANIPLTHRDWAHSVRFVTGNLTGDRVNLDWPDLAKSDQTLVIYMGLRGLAGNLSRADRSRHGREHASRVDRAWHVARPANRRSEFGRIVRGSGEGIRARPNDGDHRTRGRATPTLESPYEH